MELTCNFYVNKIFLATNEKQKLKNFEKSQILGWPAGPMIYILIAQNFLMYYSEIALSALHLVESDTTIN